MSGRKRSVPGAVWGGRGEVTGGRERLKAIRFIQFRMKPSMECAARAVSKWCVSIIKTRAVSTALAQIGRRSFQARMRHVEIGHHCGAINPLDTCVKYWMREAKSRANLCERGGRGVGRDRPIQRPIENRGRDSHRNPHCRRESTREPSRTAQRCSSGVSQATGAGFSGPFHPLGSTGRSPLAILASASARPNI